MEVVEKHQENLTQKIPGETGSNTSNISLAVTISPELVKPPDLEIKLLPLSSLDFYGTYLKTGHFSRSTPKVGLRFLEKHSQNMLNQIKIDHGYSKMARFRMIKSPNLTDYYMHSKRPLVVTLAKINANATKSGAKIQLYGSTAASLLVFAGPVKPIFLNTRNQEVMIWSSEPQTWRIKVNKFVLFNPKNRKVTLRSVLKSKDIEKKSLELLNRKRQELVKEEERICSLLRMDTNNFHKYNKIRYERQSEERYFSGVRKQPWPSGKPKLDDQANSTKKKKKKPKDKKTEKFNLSEDDSEKRTFLFWMKTHYKFDKLNDQLENDIRQFTKLPNVVNPMAQGSYSTPMGTYTQVSYYNFAWREFQIGWETKGISLGVDGVKILASEKELRKSKVFNIEEVCVDYKAVITPNFTIRVFDLRKGVLLDKKSLKEMAAEIWRADEEQGRVIDNKEMPLKFPTQNYLAEYEGNVRTKSFKIEEEDYFLLLNKPYLLLLRYSPLELISYCYLDQDVMDLNSVKDIVKTVSKGGSVRVHVVFDFVSGMKMVKNTWVFSIQHL